MGDSDRYDDVFLAVAQREGSIQGLLTAFFSFLHRRTDFFVEQESRSDAMGFPPGAAESLLRETFLRFPMKGMDGRPKAREAADGSPDEDARAAKQTGSAPSGGAAARQPQGRTAAKSERSGHVRDGLRKDGASAAASAVSYTAEGKQVPRGNGGVTPHYVWTQTLDECVAHWEAPDGLRARDLRVTIGARKVEIARARDGERLLHGELHGPVRREDSLWTMHGAVLTLNLEKASRTWWKSFLVGDEEIDTSLVDSKVKIDEYDAETQGVIRKIMFDQQQKARGLPSSDELLQQDLFDKAKYAPGSPFLPGGAMEGEEGNVTVMDAGGATLAP